MSVNPFNKLRVDAEQGRSVKELARSKPNELIGRAYAFAEKAHAKQKRQNGEPYFNHVLAAAEILHEWKLDEPTVAAGLLHDVVEDVGVLLLTVKKEFGEDVAFLVDGVTKLGRLKYRGASEKVENMRKMILSLSQDLRVVFIKLADRLHNMRTLGVLPPAKQKRIATETDEIYAPLAYRLGMQNLAGELHDLAFPYLQPRENRWLDGFAADYEDRKKYLEKIKPVLEESLRDHNIKPIVVDFRAKRRASLYKKLVRCGMDIGKVYDLIAMRIIVKSVQDCYAVLGLIHEKWPPLPGRIKDYIAMPKPNGYRSLHTTVLGPDGKKVELQVRTVEMHEENEHGIAAHWLYEQKKSGEEVSAKKLTSEVAWVQQLRGWQESLFGKSRDEEEFLRSLKIDFFKDRIFAITPKGDVIDLPVGATPVDFAYHIHTEIGNACVGAKVNDHLVSLDHQLKSGDVVEILTQKNKKPSEDWLKLVKTSMARDHIRAALREKDALRQGARDPKKAELKIVVEDRVGLIKDISTVIARSHINIVNFRAYHTAGNKFPMDKAEIATTDKRKIEKLILKLKGIKGVIEVSYKLV